MHGLVVQSLYKPRNQSFFYDNLHDVVKFAKGDLDMEWQSVSSKLPQNIALVVKSPQEDQKLTKNI